MRGGAGARRWGAGARGGGPQVPRGRWCPGGRGARGGQAGARVPSGADESRLHSAPREAAGVGGRLRPGVRLGCCLCTFLGSGLHTFDDTKLD